MGERSERLEEGARRVPKYKYLAWHIAKVWHILKKLQKFLYFPKKYVFNVPKPKNEMPPVGNFLICP